MLIAYVGQMGWLSQVIGLLRAPSVLTYKSYTFAHIRQENMLFSGKIYFAGKILNDRWSWRSRQISTLVNRVLGFPLWHLHLLDDKVEVVPASVCEQPRVKRKGDKGRVLKIRKLKTTSYLSLSFYQTQGRSLSGLVTHSLKFAQIL